MGLLSQIADELVDYPHTYLDVDIVEVETPGAVANPGEDCLFRIRVANSGPMDVNNLSLLVEGLNGTLVKSNGPTSQWGRSFTISGAWFGNVPAHQGDNPVVSHEGKFHFQPVITSTTPVDLVRVSVAGWDTDDSHWFLAHTREDPSANATYRATVSPA